MLRSIFASVFEFDQLHQSQLFEKKGYLVALISVSLPAIIISMVIRIFCLTQIHLLLCFVNIACISGIKFHVGHIFSELFFGAVFVLQYLQFCSRVSEYNRFYKTKCTPVSFVIDGLMFASGD